MNLKMTEGKKVKKALLVIDMQNVCVGKNHATYFKYDNALLKFCIGNGTYQVWLSGNSF